MKFRIFQGISQVLTWGSIFILFTGKWHPDWFLGYKAMDPPNNDSSSRFAFLDLTSDIVWKFRVLENKEELLKAEDLRRY